MTLATDEFIRRFLLHVLPRGFHRIRHYGLLAATPPVTNDPAAESDDYRPLLNGEKHLVLGNRDHRGPTAELV
ncbi:MULTISPECIES: transposase [unclassified Mesorhizobium]|uniref:transposase n=1 Tax=unclassified Mesorhizobium TaxID=325217 RepID=UPI0016747A9D|nr:MULTISPECIES: transposase [unclassified Mesorhizobium]